MKKLIVTLGLCLVAVVSFGQKKAVNDAVKMSKDAKPNFTEARTLIKGALVNAETKDDPKTWFSAGQIEGAQFDQENTKQLLGQQPDEKAMYSALAEIYPYFKKAYELDKLPDAKGKVKPKYTKDMKSIMRANMPYYMNGAIYYFEQNDYKKALDFFNQIVDIHDSPMMSEDRQAGEQVDSVYIYANYYAAIAAAQTKDSNATIAAMKRASKLDFKRSEMLLYLSEEYRNAGDTVNWENTLIEGNNIFPEEETFSIQLIQVYLYTNRNDKAIEYINTALGKNPNNAQLLDVAGRIYETGFKDYAKAEDFYKKSIAADSENAEVQSNLGRIYFNQGVQRLDEANNINDTKKYNEEREIALGLFRQALPYFEKGFKLNPEAQDNKIALRSIYYNLNMEDKLAEIEKAMNQ